MYIRQDPDLYGELAYLYIIILDYLHRDFPSRQERERGTDYHTWCIIWCLQHSRTGNHVLLCSIFRKPASMHARSRLVLYYTAARLLSRIWWCIYIYIHAAGNIVYFNGLLMRGIKARVKRFMYGFSGDLCRCGERARAVKGVRRYLL